MIGPPDSRAEAADQPQVGLKDLVGLLRPHKGVASLAALLVLFAAAVGLAQPMLASRLIEHVSAGEAILGLALLLTAFFVGQIIIDTLGRYMLERVGESVVLGLREKLVRRLLRLRTEVFDEHRLGDLITRPANDATVIRDVVARNIVEIVIGALTVVGAGILMLLLDPLIFLVVLVVFLVAVLAVTLVLGRIRQAGVQAQNSVGTFSADLERSLSALPTVRIYQAEDRETKRIIASAKGAYDAGMNAARLSAAATPAMQLAATGSFLLILVVGGARVAAGSLALGDLIALLLYATYLIIPLGNMLEGITIAKRSLGALQRINDALALPAEDNGASTRIEDGSVAEESDEHPILRMDNICFNYADRSALEGISFELRAGSRTALVGPSGSGKSTLLSLICKFREPSSGRIEHEGQDATQLSTTQVRGKIALVEQDAPVLHGSLRENLQLARPEATDGDIHEVLESVNLMAFVRSLPQGLDTPMGERGSQLSGGERQRLAIARALLARPSLLLLDEPTSSLDTTNEERVFEALERLSGKCATLIITHRPRTLGYVNNVLFLNDGRIQGQGTHPDLMRTSVEYRSLLEGRSHEGSIEDHRKVGVNQDD